MAGRRAATFPIGKVAIDGTVTVGTVTLGAGSAAIGKLAANSGVDIGDVDVTSLPAATTVFSDAAANTGAGNEAAALASHDCKFGFFVTNTHATAILYLGDSNVATDGSRFMQKVLPGETRWFPLVGNTSIFQRRGSAASTSYLLAGY